MKHTTIIFLFWYLIGGWMTDGLLYSTCVTGHLMSVVGLSRTPSPHTHTTYATTVRRAYIGHFRLTGY